MKSTESLTMKKCILSFGILFVLFSINVTYSQSLGINATGAPADASSILDLSASDRGVLIPRMLQAERFAISTPATGLLVYQTDGANGFYFYDGTVWIKLIGNGSSEKNWLLENTASTSAVNTNNQYVIGKVGIGDYTSSLVGAKMEVKSGSLGTILDDASGLSLINPTAATASSHQLSPALKWSGNGWASTGANSQAVEFTADVEPVQGTVAPSGVWRLSSSVNNGAYTSNRLAVTSGGNVGIGTASPLHRLSIRGIDGAGSTTSGVTLQLQTDEAGITDKGGSILIGDNAAATRAMIKGAFSGVGNGGYLALSTNSQANTLTERVRITDEGAVRINGLSGAGNRPVYADASGILKAGTGSSDNATWSLSADFASSPNDLGGTDLVYTGNANDGYNQYNMGFDITIDGIVYNTITIGTNGWISFGAVTNTDCCPTSGFPVSSFSNPTIFPFFTDLRDYGNNMNIRAYTFGASFNRVAIVHFKLKVNCGVSEPGNSWGLEFQVQIHEGSGLINIKYINMPEQLNGQAWNCSGTDKNTLIGFQTSGGVNAKTYPVSYNAKILDDNRMPESWSISPCR